MVVWIIWFEKLKPFRRGKYYKYQRIRLAIISHGTRRNRYVTNKIHTFCIPLKVLVFFTPTKLFSVQSDIACYKSPALIIQRSLTIGKKYTHTRLITVLQVPFTNWAVSHEQSSAAIQFASPLALITVRCNTVRILTVCSSMYFDHHARHFLFFSCFLLYWKNIITTKLQERPHYIRHIYSASFAYLRIQYYTDTSCYTSTGNSLVL